MLVGESAMQKILRCASGKTLAGCKRVIYLIDTGFRCILVLYCPSSLLIRLLTELLSAFGLRVRLG
jgi:hypothetical protein